MLVLLCSVQASIDAAPAAVQFINRQTFHLRSGERPEWDEFANQVPDGAGLMLRFASQSNAAPATLFIVQDNVKQDWGVQLDGRNIGALFLMEAPLVQSLTIPAGALLDGENTLWIRALRDQNDDIILGRWRSILAPLLRR